MMAHVERITPIVKSSLKLQYLHQVFVIIVMLVQEEMIQQESWIEIINNFTKGVTEINNTQVDNAKDLDVVMPMHNLIEHNNNFS